MLKASLMEFLQMMLMKMPIVMQMPMVLKML